MRLSAFTHIIFRARNWKPRKSKWMLGKSPRRVTSLQLAAERSPAAQRKAADKRTDPADGEPLPVHSFHTLIAVGHSSECFSFVKDWVEKKVMRQLAHANKQKGS